MSSNNNNNNSRLDLQLITIDHLRTGKDAQDSIASRGQGTYSDAATTVYRSLLLSFGSSTNADPVESTQASYEAFKNGDLEIAGLNYVRDFLQAQPKPLCLLNDFKSVQNQWKMEDGVLKLKNSSLPHLPFSRAVPEARRILTLMMEASNGKHVAVGAFRNRMLSEWTFTKGLIGLLLKRKTYQYEKISAGCVPAPESQAEQSQATQQGNVNTVIHQPVLDNRTQVTLDDLRSKAEADKVLSMDQGERSDDAVEVYKATLEMYKDESTPGETALLYATFLNGDAMIAGFHISHFHNRGRSCTEFENIIIFMETVYLGDGTVVLKGKSTEPTETGKIILPFFSAYNEVKTTLERLLQENAGKALQSGIPFIPVTVGQIHDDMEQRWCYHSDTILASCFKPQLHANGQHDQGLLTTGLPYAHATGHEQRNIQTAATPFDSCNSSGEVPPTALGQPGSDGMSTSTMGFTTAPFSRPAQFSSYTQLNGRGNEDVSSAESGANPRQSHFVAGNESLVPQLASEPFQHSGHAHAHSNGPKTQHPQLTEQPFLGHSGHGNNHYSHGSHHPAPTHSRSGSVSSVLSVLSNHGLPEELTEYALGRIVTANEAKSMMMQQQNAHHESTKERLEDEKKNRENEKHLLEQLGASKDENNKLKLETAQSTAATAAKMAEAEAEKRRQLERKLAEVEAEKKIAEAKAARAMEQSAIQTPSSDAAPKLLQKMDKKLDLVVGAFTPHKPRDGRPTSPPAVPLFANNTTPTTNNSLGLFHRSVTTPTLATSSGLFPSSATEPAMVASKMSTSASRLNVSATRIGAKAVTMMDTAVEKLASGTNHATGTEVSLPLKRISAGDFINDYLLKDIRDFVDDQRQNNPESRFENYDHIEAILTLLRNYSNVDCKEYSLEEGVDKARLLHHTTEYYVQKYKIEYPTASTGDETADASANKKAEDLAVQARVEACQDDQMRCYDNSCLQLRFFREGTELEIHSQDIELHYVDMNEAEEGCDDYTTLILPQFFEISLPPLADGPLMAAFQAQVLDKFFDPDSSSTFAYTAIRIRPHDGCSPAFLYSDPMDNICSLQGEEIEEGCSALSFFHTNVLPALAIPVTQTLSALLKDGESEVVLNLTSGTIDRVKDLLAVTMSSMCRRQETRDDVTSLKIESQAKNDLGAQVLPFEGIPFKKVVGSPKPLFERVVFRKIKLQDDQQQWIKKSKVPLTFDKCDFSGDGKQLFVEPTKLRGDLKSLDLTFVDDAPDLVLLQSAVTAEVKSNGPTTLVNLTLKNVTIPCQTKLVNLVQAASDLYPKCLLRFNYGEDSPVCENLNSNALLGRFQGDTIWMLKQEYEGRLAEGATEFDNRWVTAPLVVNVTETTKPTVEAAVAVNGRKAKDTVPPVLDNREAPLTLFDSSTAPATKAAPGATEAAKKAPPATIGKENEAVRPKPAVATTKTKTTPFGSSMAKEPEPSILAARVHFVDKKAAIKDILDTNKTNTLKSSDDEPEAAPEPKEATAVAAAALTKAPSFEDFLVKNQIDAADLATKPESNDMFCRGQRVRVTSKKDFDRYGWVLWTTPKKVEVFLDGAENHGLKNNGSLEVVEEGSLAYMH